ncbi:MAG TPA: peptidylprolyl isomerase [Ramlibacter sp.]|nr:peptidylprolyl isomerase [Ramlibacter sp.]
MTTHPHADERATRIGRRSSIGWVIAAACIGVVAGAAHAAPADAAPAHAAAAASAQFAKVGDTVITHQEFDNAFAVAARNKFYHGKPPENAMAALQREVGQSMVDEILIAKEARRRKLQPDHAAVKEALDGYEERYRTSEQWKSNRARLLPGLKAKLERDSLLEQVRKQVRNVGEPTARQLEQYWGNHKDKFTSPQQVHLGMILLKVDPSSPQAKWDGARDEGAAIVRRLRSGADFKQLAQLHSGDASAERGGDMGYVHQGMLPEPAQQAVDKLKPGEISDAVVLLEGVAVFRLEERMPPKLNPLDAVRDRARDLWKRDRGDEAWTALLAKLRRETPVKLDESHFLPLATAAKSGDTAAPR